MLGEIHCVGSDLSEHLHVLGGCHRMRTASLCWGHGDTGQGSGGRGRGRVLTGVWLVPGFELGSFSPAC